MKIFPIELLQPEKALLNAKIFKNDFLNIPTTLFYNIEIDLAEIKYQKQKIYTAIHLDFIKLNVYDLKELENRVFEFPINPEKGYIDGSIYLFDVHNPIDVPKIEFKKIENNLIATTIYFDIDFEYENTGYRKVTGQVLKVNLQFGELTIDTEIMNTDNFDAGEANTLVGQFSNLRNYKKPILQDQQIIYKIGNPSNSLLKK